MCTAWQNVHPNDSAYPLHMKKKLVYFRGWLGNVVLSYSSYFAPTDELFRVTVNNSLCPKEFESDTKKNQCIVQRIFRNQEFYAPDIHSVN